jgi:hypothetical protein
LHLQVSRNSQAAPSAWKLAMHVPRDCSHSCAPCRKRKMRALSTVCGRKALAGEKHESLPRRIAATREVHKTSPGGLTKAFGTPLVRFLPSKLFGRRPRTAAAALAICRSHSVVQFARTLDVARGTASASLQHSRSVYAHTNVRKSHNWLELRRRADRSTPTAYTESTCQCTSKCFAFSQSFR